MRAVGRRDQGPLHEDAADLSGAERIQRELDFPVYFVDDETAMLVRGDGTSHADPVVDVVSEGRWRLPGS